MSNDSEVRDVRGMKEQEVTGKFNEPARMTDERTCVDDEQREAPTQTCIAEKPARHSE